jgi:hypothetical protein
MRLKLRTAVKPLFAPAKCLVCGEVIAVGEQHYSEAVYNYHAKCLATEPYPQVFLTGRSR